MASRTHHLLGSMAVRLSHRAKRLLKDDAFLRQLESVSARFDGIAGRLEREEGSAGRLLQDRALRQPQRRPQGRARARLGRKVSPAQVPARTREPLLMRVFLFRSWPDKLATLTQLESEGGLHEPR